MAMFKMNPMYSGDPGMCVIAGSAVAQNVGPAPANTVVPAVLFKASQNAAGSALGQNESVAPQGGKVPMVINPTPAYAPQVVTNGNPTVVMLDLRAYPGDIVSVVASAIPAMSATPGALNYAPVDTSVLAIDQTNNFVYIQLLSAAGSNLNMAGGTALHFAVFIKDSYTP